jgi:hypothetical protein
VSARAVTDPLNPATARGALGRDGSVIDLSVPQTSAWMRSGAAVPAQRLRSLQVESRALGETLEVKVYLPPRRTSGVLARASFTPLAEDPAATRSGGSTEKA